VEKKMKNLFTLIIISTLFINTNAYAYLDPGTGSIIIQSLLSAIAVAMTILSVYWLKVKNFFLKFIKFFKKKKL
jgi:hypothetical protein